MSLEQLAYFRKGFQKGSDAAAVLIALTSLVVFSNSTHRAWVEARSPHEKTYEELVVHDSRNMVALLALKRASFYQKNSNTVLASKENVNARNVYISMKLECPKDISEYAKLCRKRFDSKISSTYFAE